MAIWYKGKKLGDTVAIEGKLVSAIYYKGQLIWQALSKYWRRKDKWKRNQKW